MEFNLSTAKDGILLVDKPAGWTSFDVVAKIRGQIRREYLLKGQKPTKSQLKVGHAGTLDPFATGLLIVLLGEATKKADQLLKLDKVYEATVYLGATSSTGDPEGEITQPVASGGLVPTRQDIELVLESFVGKITQVPPRFSAIKVNGQRAYKLAREGKSVNIPKRQVFIYEINIMDYQYPHLVIRTHVSSGTYIRTLAEDVGRKLGVGAYCFSLRRTKIGQYEL